MAGGGRDEPGRRRYSRSPSYSDDNHWRELPNNSKRRLHDEGPRMRRRASSTADDGHPGLKGRRYGREAEDRDGRRRSVSPRERPRRDRSRSQDKSFKARQSYRDPRHQQHNRRTERSVTPEDGSQGHKRKYLEDTQDHSNGNRRKFPSPPHRSHCTSPSPRSPKRRRPSPTLPPNPTRRSRAPLPSQADSYGNKLGRPAEAIEGPVEKQKPNYSTTGALARETNTVAGTKIVLKYNEPPDSRKPPPSQAWRLYIFKPSQSSDPIVPPIELHTRQTWLLGREAAVADLPIEHPSCSKQHAVIQFRYTTKVNELGDKNSKVRPYIIDLGSANGTILNGDEIAKERFVELRNSDVLKFGESEREYVLVLPPPDT